MNSEVSLKEMLHSMGQIQRKNRNYDSTKKTYYYYR